MTYGKTSHKDECHQTSTHKIITGRIKPFGCRLSEYKPQHTEALLETGRFRYDVSKGAAAFGRQCTQPPLQRRQPGLCRRTFRDSQEIASRSVQRRGETPCNCPSA